MRINNKLGNKDKVLASIQTKNQMKIDKLNKDNKVLVHQIKRQWKIKIKLATEQ